VLVFAPFVVGLFLVIPEIYTTIKLQTKNKQS